MSGINPQVQQGTLNRVRVSVIPAAFPALSIPSSYMGKRFATFRPEGDFVHQAETGTGVVNSPEPYVMAVIEVNLLRTLALTEAWISQFQNTAIIGDVTIHSDTAAFPPRTIHNSIIRTIQPGQFDGVDPVAMLVLRGVWYGNESLWAGL